MTGAWPFTILFEDHHCLVVAKPCGLTTASDHRNEPHLLLLVRDYYMKQRRTSGKGYLVPIHFLDRQVSGVIIFAKSSKAAERLNAQFKAQTIKKQYLAVVHNVDLPPHATCVDYLAKDHAINVTHVTHPEDPEGKLCRLSYRRIRSAGKLSLLAVSPVTGRSHQIRVQLASRGAPIVGDRKYGSNIEWPDAIALHAYSISFMHPTAKEVMTFKSTVPRRWQEEFCDLEPFCFPDITADD